MVWFLRKVIWTVPDFMVEGYRDRLHDLDELIEHTGVFHSTRSRTLFEARKPAMPPAFATHSLGIHPRLYRTP